MTAKQLHAHLVLTKWFDSTAFEGWVLENPKADYTAADLSCLTKYLRGLYQGKTPGRPTLAKAALEHDKKQQKLKPEQRRLKVWGGVPSETVQGGLAR